MITRKSAEKQIMAHFKKIIKIAQQYDPDTNYIDLAAFVSDGYMALTNCKDADTGKRLSCHCIGVDNKKIISD